MSDRVAARQFGGDPTSALPYAFGGPVLRGRLRARAEDFVVEELLGYAPSGDGEHDFLTVRKRERNTHEVARALAKLAGVPQVAIGYAGLKDRRAVTTQHFSVQLPGRGSPDWSRLNDDSLQVIDVQRHQRKIRRGGLRGNRFSIVVSAVSGDRDAAEACLRRMRDQGAPNYFGSQRFGHDGRNLLQVQAMFEGRGRRPKRELRGLLLSAARAQLFNQVLAARVADGSWRRALPGEVLSPDGSQAQFLDDAQDLTIAPRLAVGEIHPTGPLCGRHSRSLSPQQDADRVESDALDTWADWIDALAAHGLDADRRALRLMCTDLQWRWQDDGLQLEFSLPAGTYATAVLREVVGEDDQEPADRQPEAQ